MQKNNLENSDLVKGLIFLTLSFFVACVEPYEPATENFESALVVEGMITSKLKNQEIKLSQTYTLEEDTISYVNGAQVEVFSNRGESFDFRNTGNGIYRSVNPFRAEEGVGYRLEIQVNGKWYKSDEEKITGETNLDNVSAQRELNENGELGVAIFANTNEAVDGSKFYRYTYEETYKIVSPYSSGQKFIINQNGFAILVDVPEGEERKTCYNTVSSRKGILNNRTYLNSDEQDVLIKFLKTDNKKILHRYSILVKQHVISSEAYRYFETLDELSNSESIFSQNQPGFLAGNIFEVDKPDTKVIGYFEVANEAEKRIFFNFDDLFSPEEKPDPSEDCAISAPERGLGYEPGDIDYYVASGQLQYLRPAPPSNDPMNPTGPYDMVSTECIDCKVLGTPEKPEFWIDDEDQ
ncbi:MAG: DUF4249 domain-containing protein [Christiangramia sp.]|nr:DUF4249 domain-containing protein [Christiangramia sp.]